MNKKTLKFVLAAILVLPCMFLLSACGHAHDYSDAWQTDATHHWKVCKECSENGEKVQHTFDQEIAEEEYLKSAADCTNLAVYYKSCVCGVKGEETFTSGQTADDAHDYVISYVWSNDNLSCTATKTCSRDAAHIITETVTAAKVVTQQKDCEKDELSTMTATFTKTGFEAKVKTGVKTADKLGHSYPNPAIPYDGMWHELICDDCGHHENEQHDFGAWGEDDETHHARYCATCNYKEKQTHKNTSILEACPVCDYQFAIEDLTCISPLPNFWSTYGSTHFMPQDGETRVYRVTIGNEHWLKRRVAINLSNDGDPVPVSAYTFELYDSNKTLITDNLTHDAGYWYLENPVSNETYYLVLQFTESVIANWPYPEEATGVYLVDEDIVDRNFLSAESATAMETDTFKYIATGVPTGSVLIVKPLVDNVIEQESNLEIKEMKADGDLVDANYVFTAGEYFKLTITENAVYYFTFKNQVEDAKYKFVVDYEYDLVIATASLGTTNESFQATVGPTDVIRYLYKANDTQASTFVITVEDTAGNALTEGYTLQVFKNQNNTFIDYTDDFEQEGNVFTYTGNYASPTGIKNWPVFIYITFSIYEDVVVKVSQ